MESLEMSREKLIHNQNASCNESCIRAQSTRPTGSICEHHLSTPMCIANTWNIKFSSWINYEGIHSTFSTFIPSHEKHIEKFSFNKQDIDKFARLEIVSLCPS